MNILIVGHGGREHALAWKIRQSPLADKIFVAPGNAGTALEPGIENIPISATDVPSLLAFAKQNSIGLTVVGPEAPLALGIVDAFDSESLPCLGPTQMAAQLESSKAFSKHFMNRYCIPTASYACFTEWALAVEYVKQQNFPLVIKADGLAAGKGVVIAHTLQEALQALQTMLSGQILGGAGKQVVIEEFIIGEEASFMVLTDGKFALPLATAQDHKPRDEGDLGPNTGGMGAYSPAPVMTSALQQQVMDHIIYPVLQGMAKDGTPYRGFLYAGLMITPQQEIKVLEFNCRLGDPETQPILMRLKSDLLEAFLAVMDNRLLEVDWEWDNRSALGVVLAAKGYPEAYPQDEIISGLTLSDQPDTKIFHAGTVLSQDRQVKTAGGRVLCVTSLGDTIQQAQSKAYATVSKVRWANQYYRKDIGHRAIARECSEEKRNDNGK